MNVLRTILCGMLVSIPLTLLAQPGQGPIVTAIPNGGTFTVDSVDVRVEWCSARPLNGRTRQIMVNGQNVLSRFTTSSEPVIYNGQWCIYGQVSRGSILLRGDPEDNYGFQALIEDIDSFLGGTGPWFYFRPPGYTRPTASVSVLQSEYTVHDRASSSRPITFHITNEGSRPRTYQVAATCADGVTACPVSPASVLLDTTAAGRSALVTVTYTTASTPNDSGTVKVRASAIVSTPTGNATVADSAITEVVLGPASPPPGAPGVVLAGVTSTNGIIERDLCLTMKSGSAGAYECGDLRLAHALPAVTTFTKVRAPTLIYNSRHARPLALIAGDVTIRSTEGLPSQVDVTVTIGGQVVTRSWAGSEWSSPGTTRRVVVPVSGLAAGVHTFTIEARRILSGASSLLGSAAGRVVVVDRSASPFGAGWWLAGLERITVLSGTELLWVGGDGSARIYVKRGAGPMHDAPSLDRPDSLSWNGATGTRFLPDGGSVLFDANGRHTATRDRFGRETQIFVAAGSERVDSLRVPKPGGWMKYAFTYTSGLLTGASAPGPVAGGPTRDVVITQTSGRVSSIRDADLTVVSFGYGSGAEANVVRNRTDRRNYATHYTFDIGGNLVKDSLRLDNGSVIMQSWLPIESRGLAGSGAAAAQPLDSVYTLADGPRTDVADVTRLWLNALGAPVKIRNAHGDETKVIYDSAWPALASEVRSPSGLITQAMYTTRGLATSTSVINLRSMGDAASVTQYQWHATRPLPTQITRPTGDVTMYDYEPANGNVLWVQPGTDPSRRTVVDYYATGDTAGLYRSSSVPGRTERDTVKYDALANIASNRGRTGARTLFNRDAIGRVTRTRAPLDTLAAGGDTTVGMWRTDSTQYDLADQVVRQVSFGPATSYTTSSSGTQAVPADTLIVITRYDNEGNVIEVERRPVPVRAGVEMQLNAYTYDAAGRQTRDVSPVGDVQLTLDAAGAVLQRQDGPSQLTMEYDALGRLRRRIATAVNYLRTQCSFFAPYGATAGCNFSFPISTSGSLVIAADTAVFQYDKGGNSVRADNKNARIRRAFSPGGLLLADTSRVRTLRYESEGSPAVWQDFANHIYALGMTYDVGGRRVTLAHPDVLDPCASACPTQKYAYHPVTGALDSLIDVRGQVFRFRYNVAGQLDSLVYPGNVREVIRQYDAEGRMLRREVIDAVGALVSDTMRYDAQGRIARASGLVPGRAGNQVVRSVYAGLGALAMMEHAVATAGPRVEEYKNDALGNRTWSRRYGSTLGPQDNPSVRFSWHDAQGRLQETVSPTDPSQQFEDVMRTYWEISGRLEGRGGHVTRSSGEPGGTTTTWTQEMHYYGGDGKLSLLERHKDIFEASPGEDNDLIERYRYDALGRRVLVHTLRGRLICRTAGCESTVRRFAYDGDNILYETRGPAGDSTTWYPVSSATVENDRPGGDGQFGAPKAFGTVGYTHAGGIDRPIGLVRIDGGQVLAAFAPHTNWRGLYEIGTDEGGVHVTRSIGWPGKDATAFIGQNAPTVPYEWFGALITEQADASGLLYRRNRYYDPQTGRFTQADPIGLAGGLNTYGFAEGDPVNFGDPFGLFPLFPTNFSPRGVTAGVGNYKEWLEAKLEQARQIASRKTLLIAGGVEAAAGAIGLLRTGIKGVLEGANYAQRGFREFFSGTGKFAGKSIDDVAGALKSGDLAIADVPVQYVVRNGQAIILNTRSAVALERAGIPRSQWNAVDMTGNAAAEARLTAQLERNRLGPEGTRSVEPQ
jgi:RHS repeat-associated protein